MKYASYPLKIEKLFRFYHFNEDVLSRLITATNKWFYFLVLTWMILRGQLRLFDDAVTSVTARRPVPSSHQFPTLQINILDECLCIVEAVAADGIEGGSEKLT